METAQKRELLTKKTNEYTRYVSPGQMTSLGDDEVRHYFKVFVNRDPDEAELGIYRNHPDNKQMLKDLSMMRKDAQPKKIENQAGNPQSFQGQGGPLSNFGNLISSAADRVGQSLNRTFGSAFNAVKRTASNVGQTIGKELHGGGYLPVTSGKGYRTDRHNNPTAFTTDVARNFGLVEGVDYTMGDPFPNNPRLRTAKLLGDPIATTIKGIDKGGFYTQGGKPRWSYLNSIPGINNWQNLTYGQKAAIIAQMYKREGGSGTLASGTRFSGSGGSNVPALANLQTLGNVTTNFGEPTRDTDFHTGMDIANKEGTIIPKLSGPGKVVSSGQNGDYGNQVTIKNDDGTTESYSHLRRAFVKPGQRVRARQPVAAMGRSGNSWSPSGGDPSHLHYELTDAYNQLINPASYLKNR